MSSAAHVCESRSNLYKKGCVYSLLSEHQHAREVYMNAMNSDIKLSACYLLLACGSVGACLTACTSVALNICVCFCHSLFVCLFFFIFLFA